MNTRRNITVYAVDGQGAEAPVEMCEHKGIGHPDTVTDAVCEAVALELVRTYESTFGGGMHFNVDKGLLVGGRSEPRFGGGRVLERPKLIVCGREWVPEVSEATVRLLSAIGRPLDEPQAAAVGIAGEASPAVRERVRALVDAEFESLGSFLADLSRGRLRVY